MPGLIPSIVALATAAITTSPALPPPDSDTWSRTSTSTSCHSSRGNQLSAEEARQLKEEIRRLVTELTVVADDFQATALGNSLRSMGFTPAVDTGWRQQIHDMADTLMQSSEDPMAEEVAVRMASAGFSPTPADVRFGPAARSGLVAAAAPVDPDGTTTADLLVICSTGGEDTDASDSTSTADWQDKGRELAEMLADVDDPAAEEVAAALADAGLTDRLAGLPDRSTERPEDGDTDTDSTDTGGDRDDDPDPPADDGSDVGEDGSTWDDRANVLADDLAGAGDDPATRDITDALTEAGITSEGGADHPSGSDRGAESGADDSTDTGHDDHGGGDGGDDSGDDDSGDDDSGDDASGDDASGDGSGGNTGGDDSSGDDSSGEPVEQQEAPIAPEEPAPTGEPAPAGDDGTWDALAACESTNRWDINSGNGYYGGLQFDKQTWLAYEGDEFAQRADQATREQQIEVAERVRDDRGGYGAWPACSEELGLPT